MKVLCVRWTGIYFTVGCVYEVKNEQIKTNYDVSLSVANFFSFKSHFKELKPNEHNQNVKDT